MSAPGILAIVEGRRFPHAAYAVEELLARCAVPRRIVKHGETLPDLSEFDGVLFYAPQNVAPPETDLPLVHVLASGFFGDRFETADSLPEAPFIGRYPSPALFLTPQEYFTPRPMKRGTVVFEDYIASAYLLLSGHEERVRPHLDEHQRFHGRASILFRGGVLERPLVEDYAAELAAAFGKVNLRFPERPHWPGGAQMALCLTCDVDLPRRNTWKAALRALAGRSGLYEDDSNRPPPWSYIPRSRVPDPYADLEGMMRRGDVADAAWTFFFLAGERSKLDPYSLKDDLETARRARALTERTAEIGLHAPYNCWDRPKQYRLAMEEFEAATGIRPQGARQHYLRMQVPQTWRSQAEAGLGYDVSAGFSCCEGFRFGTTLPFRAFDTVTESVLPLWIIPLTMMDVTLRVHKKYSPEIALQKMERLADETRRVGGVFTLLWHNSSVGPGWEAWEETFDTFLHSMAEKQVWAPTCARLLTAWRQISDLHS